MLCIEITDCRGIFQCGSNKWIQIYMNAIHSIYIIKHGIVWTAGLICIYITVTECCMLTK